MTDTSRYREYMKETRDRTNQLCTDITVTRFELDLPSPDSVVYSMLSIEVIMDTPVFDSGLLRIPSLGAYMEELWNTPQAMAAGVFSRPINYLVEDKTKDIYVRKDTIKAAYPVPRIIAKSKIDYSDILDKYKDLFEFLNDRQAHLRQGVEGLR